MRHTFWSASLGLLTLLLLAAPVTAGKLWCQRDPVMLLSGTKDPRIGAAMPAVDSIMKANHKDYFGRNYEGAVHGFVRAQDDSAHAPRDRVEEAANLAALRDAWPRTIEFLRKNLGITVAK